MMASKEEYEKEKEKRVAEREAEARARRHKKTLKISARYAVVLLAVLLVGYGAFALIQNADPEGPDLSKAVPIMGREHIPVGASHEVYNSNPPTSGPHYAETARTGFREEAIADEHIVHNLEHGDIWISYQPDITDEVIAQLRSFAGGKVIVTPREENETDIALAAWGRLDTFDVEGGVLPEQRIEDFIARYINRGPERVGVSHGGV